MEQRICGLGHFANEAARKGYANPDGTVNLLKAMQNVKDGVLQPNDSFEQKTAKKAKDIATKVKDSSFVKTLSKNKLGIIIAAGLAASVGIALKVLNKQPKV